MESSNDEEVEDEDTASAVGQVIQMLATTIICLSGMPGQTVQLGHGTRRWMGQVVLVLSKL